MTGDREAPTERLAAKVRRESARRRRHQEEGERPLGLNLATIGALGWLVVTPMLGGVLAGRALDRMAGTGILWSGAFLMLGAALGGWLAWRRMTEMGSE